MAGIAVSIVWSIVVVLSGRSIPLLFTGTIISFMGLGIPAGLLGVMFADTVDYIEWKSGVRSTGIVYSVSSIGIKAGQGLGGALGAAVMALGNYIPNVVQSASSLRAIQFDFSWVILIAVVLLWLEVYFYKVDRLYPQISEDLKNRRASTNDKGDPALSSYTCLCLVTI